MATATAAKITTAKTRSLELASEHGWHGAGSSRTVAAAFDTAGQLVSLTVAVPSETSERVYSVTYQASRDDAVCTCEAGRRGKACGHRGQGIRAGRYVARRAALGWPED